MSELEKWIDEEAEKARYAGRGLRSHFLLTHSLLAKVSPEYAETGDKNAVKGMPLWLAHLTNTVYRVHERDLLSIMKQYAALSGRWHKLSESDWERTRVAVLQVVLTEVDTRYPTPASREVLKWLNGDEALRDTARSSALLACKSAKDALKAAPEQDTTQHEGEAQMEVARRYPRPAVAAMFAAEAVVFAATADDEAVVRAAECVEGMVMLSEEVRVQRDPWSRIQQTSEESKREPWSRIFRALLDALAEAL